MTTSLPIRARRTPNLFGIAFGLVGLAQCWTVAHTHGAAPAWPGTVLWLLTAAVWLYLLAIYVRDLIGSGRWRTELADPTFGAFVPLVAIVPMQLGVALAGYSRPAGLVVFVVAFASTVALGGWLSGQWIIVDRTLEQWHPGYFLPTVAGGLIASIGWSAFGYQSLAIAMFGYGVVCWMVLGSILLQRLFTQPALPTPLVPTMAIEIAPPVVAGLAWFGINGDRVDAVALGLAGYAVLMALVQVRLLPVYRRVPFAAGWWAFSFSYAATFDLGMRWLAATHAPAGTTWIRVLLGLVSAFIAVLAAGTVRALTTRTFLPRPSAMPAVHP